jgi:hypothetical protein
VLKQLKHNGRSIAMAYVPVGGALRRTAPHRPRKQFPAAGVRLQDDERVEQKPAARSSERGAWKTSSSANARCGPLKIQYLSRDLRFELHQATAIYSPSCTPHLRCAEPDRVARIDAVSVSRAWLFTAQPGAGTSALQRRSAGALKRVARELPAQ